ncbi:hypothetical protein CEXT_72051 [Caerostris extrusa]|uniref:Uncharacterized protein n=1 Tax=Caerostris extrusa TaxID=172846 RepID=A0AAV4XZS4_CAEEX|nr:hypothetical protein CEXT_72051 [Caerostris extrusa]
MECEGHNNNKPVLHPSSSKRNIKKKKVYTSFVTKRLLAGCGNDSHFEPSINSSQGLLSISNRNFPASATENTLASGNAANGSEDTAPLDSNMHSKNGRKGC